VRGEPPTDHEPDLDLDDVGKDAQMPWETDGRRWHTHDRVSHSGTACRWEGEILDWIDKQIHKRGAFSPTNWNHRSVIEIAAVKKSQGWFFHGMSGMEWLVRLVFRVGRNTFKQSALVERLGIPPLNETPGVEAYGNEERVRAANRKGPWQEVTVLAHRLSEIDTPAFQAFLDQAVKAFQASLNKQQTNIESVMPWKVNGQRWHLGEKGFAPAKAVKWDRSLLPRLLELVRAMEPKIEVEWDARDAIKLRLPGVGRSWAQVRTKDFRGLDCRFLGKKGQFNLSQLEGLGVHPQIAGHRAESDVMRLVFQQAEQMPAGRLKEVLAEHLRGFQEMVGK
jgi:excinuclease ABC subunit A